MVSPGRPRRSAARRAGGLLRTIARQEEQTQNELNTISDHDSTSDDEATPAPVQRSYSRRATLRSSNRQARQEVQTQDEPDTTSDHGASSDHEATPTPTQDPSSRRATLRSSTRQVVQTSQRLNTISQNDTNSDRDATPGLTPRLRSRREPLRGATPQARRILRRINAASDSDTSFDGEATPDLAAQVTARRGTSNITTGQTRRTAQPQAPGSTANVRSVQPTGILTSGSGGGTKRKRGEGSTRRRVRFDFPSPKQPVPGRVQRTSGVPSSTPRGLDRVQNERASPRVQSEFELTTQAFNDIPPEIQHLYLPPGRLTTLGTARFLTAPQYTLPFRPLRTTHSPEDEELAARQYGFDPHDGTAPPRERTAVIAHPALFDLLNGIEGPRSDDEGSDTWSNRGIPEEAILPELMLPYPCGQDHWFFVPKCIHCRQCIECLINEPVPDLPELPANPNFEALVQRNDPGTVFTNESDAFASYTQDAEDDSGDWRSLPPRDLPEYMSYRVGPQQDQRLMKNQMPPIRWLGDIPAVPEHADYSDPRHWAALTLQDEDSVWRALQPTIEEYRELTGTEFHRWSAPWVVLGYHQAHALVQWRFSQWCLANLEEEHPWVGYGVGMRRLFKAERWYGLLEDFEYAPNWPVRRRDRDGKIIQNPDCFACEECVALDVFCHGHREHGLQCCQPCLQNRRACSKAGGWEVEYNSGEFEEPE